MIVGSFGCSVINETGNCLGPINCSNMDGPEVFQGPVEWCPVTVSGQNAFSTMWSSCGTQTRMV
jgi:hypothetical protein